MRRKYLWQAAFSVAGGLSLSSALVLSFGAMATHAVWAIATTLLAGLAALVVIPVEPHGFLYLSPVVFLVSSIAFGVGEGVVAAVLAPILAYLASYRTASSSQSVGDVLAVGGEAATSLVVASGLLRILPFAGSRWLDLTLLSTLTLLLSFLLQAVRISSAEGVRLRRLLGPLLRSSAPHLLSLLVGTLLVWAVFSLIGPLGILLTAVVIIELYYPWKLLGDQRDLFLKSLQMISNAVDLKDPYTAHHSRRVSMYAVRMARILDTPEEEVERIRIGALMHDIGKIGVPGGIIRKPSKLTDEEMETMKRHVEAGASIVEELEILNRSTDIVQHHHENFDGTGYPAGLAGQQIPLGARIVFVADAFDALTTDRPYRQGRSTTEALGVLDTNASTQFDPRAVEALKKVLRSTE